jgi:integrase
VSTDEQPASTDPITLPFSDGDPVTGPMVWEHVSKPAGPPPKAPIPECPDCGDGGPIALPVEVEAAPTAALTDTDLVRRLSMAFGEVDRVAKMKRQNKARRTAADEAVTAFRIELGRRITDGTFTAWQRLGISDEAPDPTDRRAPDKGSVYFDRSRDRWIAEVTVNSKRSRKLHKTETDARQWLSAASKRLADGQTATAKTWVGHRAAADKWWIPALGSRRLDSVKIGDIENVIGEMVASGLASNSVRVNTATMGKAMKLALRDEHVTRNVVSLAERPPPENVREKKFLTPDEAIEVFKLAADDEMHGDALSLSLWLGLRRGEALGMSWEAIDFDAGTITLGAQVVRGPDGVELKPWVKGGKLKERQVPIWDAVAPIIERRKKRQMENRLAAGAAWVGGTPGTSGLVFTDGVGGWSHPDTYSNAVKRMTKAAGHEIPAHALRHSTASLLNAAGVPMKTVQDILGHSTIGMTMDIYAHSFDDDMRGAGEKMNLFLNGA